jgi:hypothetical protein
MTIREASGTPKAQSTPYFTDLQSPDGEFSNTARIRNKSSRLLTRKLTYLAENRADNQQTHLEANNIN